MHAIVFLAPTLVALVSFAVWYFLRPVDLGAIALQIAEDETRTEFENERWSIALRQSQLQTCNRTMRGY